MAQRRMLNTSLGRSSKKFAKLNELGGDLTDFCQILYPLVMVTSDDHGRNLGDAFGVKYEVFPISKHSEHDFERALQALHDAFLITLYESAGRRYLYVHNFRREQPGIKYIANPKFPDPPAEVYERERLAGNFQETPETALFPELGAQTNPEPDSPGAISETAASVKTPPPDSGGAGGQTAAETKPYKALPDSNSPGPTGLFPGLEKEKESNTKKKKETEASVRVEGGRRRKAAGTPPPENMPITDTLQKWAAAHVPAELGLKLETETEAFLQKARACGWTYLDWESGRRSWLLNAVKFTRERLSRQTGQNGGNYGPKQSSQPSGRNPRSGPKFDPRFIV